MVERLDCATTAIKGQDYRGTVNVTKSGIPCARWDSDEPHRHRRKNNPAVNPDAGLENNNYCRNPDLAESGPWCYTTDPDVKMESCMIPSCEATAWNDEYESIFGEVCQNCTVQECGSPSALQADYRGTLNVTESGRTCQRWDATEPWNHDDTMPEARSHLDLRENYCRMAKHTKNHQPRVSLLFSFQPRRSGDEH